MRKIVFTNISGGEGKTFLTFQVAHALKALGYRVAVIDGDPQASLTKRFGLNDLDDNGKTKVTKNAQTILSVWEGEPEAAVLPPPLEVNGISVWPANSRLGDAISFLINKIDSIENLHVAVKTIENQFDFLLIDSQPNTSNLLTGLIAAANHVVVPISGDKGMENLDELVKLIKTAKRFNPNVRLKLFVPNRAKNTKLSKEVLDRIEDYKELAPISPTIRDATVGGESENARTGVIHYAKNSPLAEDIRQLTQKIIEVTHE